MYTVKLTRQAAGDLKETFKYRVGVYRIIYTIERKILLVTVIDIGHRKEVYR